MKLRAEIIANSNKTKRFDAREKRKTSFEQDTKFCEEVLEGWRKREK